MHTTKVLFSALAFVGSANGAQFRSNNGLRTNPVPTTDVPATFEAPADTASSSTGAYDLAPAPASYDPSSMTSDDASSGVSCSEFGIVGEDKCGPTCDMACKDMYAKQDNASEEVSDYDACDNLAKKKQRQNCRKNRRKARRKARKAAQLNE